MTTARSGNKKVVSDPTLLVEIRNLTKYYQRGGQIIPVLVDIDLDVRLGDFAALMGPSGSGQSRLLNLIAGIDKASGGPIQVGGVDVARLAGPDLRHWRGRAAGLDLELYL